jgi:hypothetical protein
VGRPGAGFEVEFVEADGGHGSAPLADCWSRAFEDAAPVRSFSFSKGMANFPGWYWSATSCRHVGYESWLERDHARLLDFDRSVVGFSSQPFRLFWEQDGRRRRHTPDFFARRADGSGVVIDVRPDGRIKPRDDEAFAATERACAEVGWEFRRLGAPDAVLMANVRWLAGYRHPRCHRPADADALLRVFAEPIGLRAGAERVGPAVAVLPVLFHLMWSGLLVADLRSSPLRAGSRVTVGGGQ